MTEVHDDGWEPLAPVVAVSQGPFAVSSAPSSAAPSPRAALLEQLFASARDAVAAGDMEAARIAHEAAGMLFAAPLMEGSGAKVLNLAHELGKRGRS